MAELLAMLGQPHTLAILHAFERRDGRPIRFRDLQSQLSLSPKTLTLRLKTLVESGFLTRRAYNEIPPRVEYEPTRKASELGTVFRTLDEWAQRNSLTAIPVISTVGRVRPMS